MFHFVRCTRLARRPKLWILSTLTTALGCSPQLEPPAGTGGSAPGPEASGGTATGAAPGTGGETSTGGASFTSGGANSATGGASEVSTGGTPAAGGGGGSGGSNTGACQAAGVLFCETFEEAPLDQPPPAPWSLAMNGEKGTALVDGSTEAHSGSRSVRVESAGNYQTFFALAGAPVFPTSTPALYLRAFLKLDEPMTGGHNTYFKAGAAGGISSENETRVGVMFEMLMINQPDADRGFLSNQNYWTNNQPGVVFEPRTWTCIESYFDPPNSTVRFWVNEIEVTDLHITDWKQDALGSFHFGFEKYAGPDATLWYDDIIISTAPIGCGP